ncbi:MAG TPA: hypothetical protein VF450_23010 [Noviherbaspirillum sp.]
MDFTLVELHTPLRLCAGTLPREHIASGMRLLRTVHVEEMHDAKPRLPPFQEWKVTLDVAQRCPF